MTPNDSEPKKRGIYLNSPESKVLSDRIDELKKSGVRAGQATIIRALMHLTPSDEMFALSVKLFAEDALAGRKSNRSDGTHPTIEVTDKAWDKIGGVVERLARRGLTCTHNLVVRALVANTPSGPKLVTLLEKFREEVPNRPRGPSALRRPHD